MNTRLAIAAIVAGTIGCGGGSSSSGPVGPTSVGDGNNMPGGGGPGGGGSGGGGSGGPGGGGSGGMGGGGSGGGGSGGMGGGGSGGSGGGMGCDLAAPTPLVRGVHAMRSIAVDAGFVYYTDVLSDGTAGAYRVAKTGGSPTALIAVGSAAELAVDDINVYVAESGTVASGGVHVLPKTGGAERFIGARALGSCGNAHPRHLVTMAGELYWIQRDDTANQCAPGIEVERVPAGSDTPMILAGGDEDNLGGIFVDATHLFYSFGTGIQRIDRIGGGAIRLDPHDASFFASDGNTLYSSYGARIDATTAPSVFHDVYVDPSVSVTGLAADTTHLWIAASHLIRIDLASGASTVISDATAAGPVAVDDRYAYYFDSAGEILKACK